MEVSDDSDDNTPLCWIDHKTDVLKEYKAREIKEELDEDVIYIDSELDLKPDLIQFDKDIATDLLKVPIIYTTKLEEMKVFKRKFDEIDIQRFTERVYEESKPKYIRASFKAEQSSSHRHDGFPSPLYCAMEKKINVINKKCVSRNFGKHTRHDSAKKVENSPTGNKKILSKFKNVSVVLNDFRKTKDLPLKPKNRHTLLVKDKQSNSIDIFITTAGSKITQHHNFVCGEPLPTVLTTVKLSEHTVCCWYTREEFFLSQNSNLKQHNNVVRLGQRPHGCVQNKCKCCCKHKQSVVSDSASKLNLPDTVDTAMRNLKENIHNSISKISNTAGTSLLNAQSNDSFRNILLSKIKPSSSPHKLILKTLTYNKPLTQKKICGLTYEKKDNLKGKLIHLTNTKTNELEFYELDNDGDVCAHAQFEKRTVAHDYLLDFNKPKIIANICCWVKRENIISKLITKQLSNSAIKLIRRPHRCFPGKCSCCCYAASIRNNTLLDIALNKGEHSLNYTMSYKVPKIASVISVKKFNDDISTVNETTTEQATPVQKMDQTQHVQVSEQLNTVNTSSQSNLHFSNTTNLINTSDNLNQKLNQCLNVNAIIERNGSKFVESVQIGKGTIDSATKLRTVTAILEAFRNARLTINNEGKVAAELNTPASTLSTIELKVLAHILSSAQNEVNNVLKSNSSEGNTGMTLSNFTQIDDRPLNKPEQNPAREVITNKKTMMTPPLTIGESLPTLVCIDKNMLSDFNYKLETKQNQLQHSFRSFNNNLRYECDANEITKVPQIQNVYSLNHQQKINNYETDASSSATMWYIEPKKKESPQCSILQKRMDLMLKSDLLSSRELLKYKSLRELKRKSTDDLQNISETEAPVKILNSSISDTISKTRMSRYQIISSNDSKESKSPNDLTLVKSNTKSKPSQIDCSPVVPAHSLSTQSNPTVINMTLKDTELNNSNPGAVSVVPYKFAKHPSIHLKKTRKRNKVQVVGDKEKDKFTSALTSGICDNLAPTFNSQRPITMQNINVQKLKQSKPPSDLKRAEKKTGSQTTKIQNIDLKHTMLPRPIAPKPMMLPHDSSFAIIVPADTPVQSETFSPKTNQRNGAEFGKSSTKIKTKSVEAINANGSGDAEAADQDVEFLIKISDDNVNVEMTENDDDSARMATIADESDINLDSIVISDDVDKNSVIADNKTNGDDECILGV